MKQNIKLFNQHVREPDFLLGVEKQKWGIHNDSDERPTWPFVDIWIAAKPTTSGPDRFYFRFDLTGYNGEMPSACIWDIAGNVQLPADRRPKTTEPFHLAFRSDWENGRYLYLPIDKRGYETHADWQTTYSEMVWKKGVDKIDKYTSLLHRILNGGFYHGV